MNSDFTAALAALRARIDTLDDAMIAMLKERIAIVADVSALKRAHTPSACHIRSGREGDMHARIYAAFKDSPFSAVAALSIWRQIIGTSTHLESPITLSIPQHSSDLCALAREYFGHIITIKNVQDLSEAIVAVATKKATITLLPASSDTQAIAAWKTLPTSPLKIFASLPVVLAPSEAPIAYAASIIEPEASAHDETLFIGSSAPAQAKRIIAQSADATIYSLPGFMPPCSDTALGVIPVPLTDDTLTPREIAL